jgi:hypothetical protein
MAPALKMDALEQLKISLDEEFYIPDTEYEEQFLEDGSSDHFGRHNIEHGSVLQQLERRAWGPGMARGMGPNSISP